MWAELNNDMDWRNRKYFAVSFIYGDHNWHISHLSCCSKYRVHPPVYPPLMPGQIGYSLNRDRFMDEREPRGYYSALISCRTEDAACLCEYLSKISSYKEIKPTKLTYEKRKSRKSL